ncbi:unnamed protein product [Nesidiocoris tenuis]|uniref:RBR-type E3 ubiquitin transferase n=1 Tax=Nesidiocoris tenuis TaxID=355587 RepID=A0A6H5GMV9_9HEMI|nr:unnamed protein product [Nesidiocoris tenuis]
MIGGAGGGGDDDSGGSGRRGRGGRDGRAERPSSLVKSWYGALHEEDDDGSQKTLLPERLKWRSSLALGSSLLSRLSRSRLEMEPSGGGDQLRKVHTSPWLALTNSEPMKPINRLRTSTMCSRCSSLLSMASSSRYSISAEGQYVQVPQSQQPQSQQQHHSHSILCKLCLTTVPMADTWTLQCSCSFCAECMKAYVEFEISQGAYEISCPDAMCEAQGVVSLSEIENLVNSDLMEKHRRYRLNKEVEDNEKLIWCPSAGCETVCTLTPLSAHKVHCPSCSTDFCSLCRGPWHGGGALPSGRAGPRHTFRLGAHQVLSHVRRPHRERRRLRPDDVQTLQARLLLVLPGIARRRLPPPTLRQGPLQEQTGPFAGLGDLASNPGDRDFRRFRHPAPRRFAAAPPRRALHSMLQVPRMHRRPPPRTRRRTARRIVRSGAPNCAVTAALKDSTIESSEAVGLSHWWAPWRLSAARSDTRDPPWRLSAARHDTKNPPRQVTAAPKDSSIESSKFEPSWGVSSRGDRVSDWLSAARFGTTAEAAKCHTFQGCQGGQVPRVLWVQGARGRTFHGFRAPECRTCQGGRAPPTAPSNGLNFRILRPPRGRAVRYILC